MTRRRTNKMTLIARRLTLVLVILAFGSTAFVYLRWLYREQRCNKLIEEIAVKYEVDKFLIKAVVRQESGFDPFALSSAGAIGLMQVTEGAGQDWARVTRQENFSRDSLWNEHYNVEAGTWYLGQALRYWQRQGVDDPVPFALAEYNAGRGNVQKWLPSAQPLTAAEFIASIKNSGVRYYVQKVMAYYEQYKERGEF